VRATRRNRLFAALLSSGIAVGVVATPVAALAAPSAQAGAPEAGALQAGTAPASGTPAGPAQGLAGDERRVCPVASAGQMECQSVYRLAGRHRGAQALVPASARVAGYGPASLRAAYGLIRAAATRGRGETIAIVDAYSNPAAARDLASYRSRFHLGSCRVSSGCLRIVNQRGRSGPLPKANAGWAVEESLDLDMVSAICPRCKILVVEANSPSPPSLGAAENAAVALGARFVSNSWSGTEFPGQWTDNHYFNHPGDAIVFAGGDAGYGTVYPADLQYVTAVGGTTLRHVPSGSRPWTETVWGSSSPAVTGGTGSGCSPQTAKPSWQRKPVDIAANGCVTRTENDVAAVANPATGVAVYDTYRTHGTWLVLGGTSAATPIITAVYALAGYPAPRSYPASYPYQHPARFHDVTSGLNGVCPAARSYLCHGKVGYDGPTGVGTPDGSYGFSRQGTDPVTLVDPGAKRAIAGAALRVTITGLNARTAASSLAYTAAGLPAGLSIRRIPGSNTGTITGTVSASIASGTVFHVLVTGTDAVARARGVTRFTITVT